MTYNLSDYPELAGVMADEDEESADEDEVSVDDWTAPELQYSPAHLALIVLVVGAGLLFPSFGTPLWWITGWLAFIAWPGIPALIYYDIGQITDRTDWDTNVAGWMIGGVIPVVNVSVGLVYLLERHIRIHDITYAEAASIWFKALVVSILLPVLAIPVGLVVAGALGGSAGFWTGFTLFFYGPWIAAIVVYLDAEYVEELGDWDPFEEGWAAFSLFVPVFGAATYLFMRTASMD